jgi:citrate lyase beta subunit
LKRRSWLFVPGADPQAHRVAARSGADVIILELEDAVRVNPLETCGREDLDGVLPAEPEGC